MAAICHWCHFLTWNSPIPSQNVRRNAARSAPAHLLSTHSKSSITRFTGFTEFLAPLGSDNSHFFKWLFTKMAVSMVSDPESEHELAQSHLMLKNAWRCFRISSSFVGNNPSLQIHSFSEDRGKCNKTCNPSISDFPTILTSHTLILAESSHLPCDEAYRQCLSLPCSRLSTPCYECKPNAGHFSTKFSLKRDTAAGKCVYSVTCHM